MKRALAAMTLSLAASAARAQDPLALVDAQVAAHAGSSGAYVLDSGSEALLARAWLADHAQHAIDVQYFIWSTDNIGILAAEALLRAAERGVKVRVLVDDLLIDAPDESLLALAKHPNIEIRIYNPTGSVGVTLRERVLNLFADFRGVNQRMHNKTFTVDGKVVITGGRNMAAEYFDYNHQYNFRDRDALVVGPVVASVVSSFNHFWTHELSVPVEQRFDGRGLLKKHVEVQEARIREIYRDLHAYAADPENFSPEVRAALASMAEVFPKIAQDLAWGEVRFVSDAPGKNAARGTLDGSGLATEALVRLVSEAKQRVVIQSPYLIMSPRAQQILGGLVARGVKVRIGTNSLAATDNIPAYSGYRKQRAQLLAAGFEIFEYRPDAALQRARMLASAGREAICALHAKTMVIDGATAFIGTFNFDPRSANLNTEVGVVIRNAPLAAQVEAAMQADFSAGNSWPAGEQIEASVPWGKRLRARLWQALPMEALL